MTASSSSAIIAGPCSSAVALTNAVNPEMSARTSTPSSVELFMPSETPAKGTCETAQTAPPTLRVPAEP